MRPFLRRCAVVLSSAVLLAGCGPEGQWDPNSPEGGAESSYEQGLTDSPATAGNSYVVHVGNCTGTVIAPHYIITAAHCFNTGGAMNVLIRGGQSSETTLYNATADVLLHPNWVDQAADRESWDLAVVHLRGAGLSTLGRAKIYKDPETPWKSKGQDLFIEGYGFGSDVGGVQSCADTDQTTLTKRRNQFDFEGTGRNESGVQQSAHVKHSSRTTCPGDSGAPYFIHRNNSDFFVAVHSRSQRVPNGIARGTLFADKLSWAQAYSQLIQPAMSCSIVRDHRFPTATEHYDCTEAPVRRPPVVGGLKSLGNLGELTPIASP